MRGIWIDHLREEAEDEDDDAVTHTKRVEQDAPNTRDMEWAPDELVGVPGRTGHLAGVTDRPSDAMPKEEAFDEDVGRVEAADADGDDVVEGCCGTNIDQAYGAGHASHDKDCVQWDSGAYLNLFSRFNSVPLTARGKERRTVLMVRQNGRPLSRPKAKTMRDEVARKAIAAQMSMTMIMQIMTEAPVREPVTS